MSEFLSDDVYEIPTETNICSFFIPNYKFRLAVQGYLREVLGDLR